MNRFVAKLVQGSARLAFWRKRVETASEQVQSLDPATSAPRTESPDVDVSAAEPQARPGWLTRFKQALGRRKSSSTLPLLVDQIVEADASPAHESGADDPAESPLPPRLTLLARFKSMLRRRPQSEQAEADAVTADVEEPSRTTTRRDAEPDDEDADTPPPGRMARVLALLTSKRVLIPGVGVAVLAIMGTMTFMLVQSKQETEKLQADLLAAEKKIKQATVVKPDASSKAAMRQGVSMQADNPDHSSVASAADVQPGLSEGDCVVSNKESVTKNLKNCIEAFNAISR